MLMVFGVPFKIAISRSNKPPVPIATMQISTDTFLHYFYFWKQDIYYSMGHKQLHINSLQVLLHKLLHHLNNKYQCVDIFSQGVSADEFVSLLQSKKKFPKRTALITFDDGYADNYLDIPVFLIDGTTRKGMSGSPVIMKGNYTVIERKTSKEIPIFC